MRFCKDTGRTAMFSGGRTERIFECWQDEGMFAGALYEMLESELTEAELAAAALNEGREA